MNKEIRPSLESIWTIISNKPLHDYWPWAYTGALYNPNLTTKEIGAIIRKELKEFFPNISFNLTTQYNKISIEIKSCNVDLLNREYIEYSNSSYEEFQQYKLKLRSQWINYNEMEHTEYWNYILGFIQKMLTRYNFDDSDAMTDYFHCNFYIHLSISRNLEIKEYK